MKNSTEFGAKENELRQKENETQQRIQALEHQNTLLIKEISDTKNKCDRVRKIAKKYKESGKAVNLAV